MDRPGRTLFATGTRRGIIRAEMPHFPGFSGPYKSSCVDEYIGDADEPCRDLIAGTPNETG
jgi:hypothetical protein